MKLINCLNSTQAREPEKPSQNEARLSIGRTSQRFIILDKRIKNLKGQFERNKIKSMDLTKIKEHESSSTDSRSRQNQSLNQRRPRGSKIIRSHKSIELIKDTLVASSDDLKLKYFDSSLIF